MCGGGEKSILILCLFSRSEHTDTCSGRLKAWCLNCVVSESCYFHKWFCQDQRSEEVHEQQTELLIISLGFGEQSQLVMLMLHGDFHILAIGDKNCWSGCITGSGSCPEIPQTDFFFLFF